AYCPEHRSCLNFEMSGAAFLQVDLAYHPTAKQPFTYQLKGQVKRSRLRQAQLPFPLEEMDAVFHFAGAELLFESCQGKAQHGTFSVTGTASGPDNWSLKCEGKNMLLQPELYPRLPDAVKAICQEYQPFGRISVAGQIRQQEKKQCFEYTLQPQGLS